MTRIYVCPLSELEDTLAQSQARWMISLSGPGKTIAKPAKIDQGFLPLEFNDISELRDGLTAPDITHITALINFIKDWDGQGNLLIHCWMGISRSTAAALIALATLAPDRNMLVLSQLLRQNSPMATPNSLMVSIADAELQLDRRLVDAVRFIGRGAEASQGQAFSLDVGL